MRVERERQVEAERQAAEEEAAWMDAERRATVMKAERQAAAVKFFSDFRLASDSFQIDFRLVVWKIINTDFRLVQIGSD